MVKMGHPTPCPSSSWGRGLQQGEPTPSITAGHTHTRVND